MNADKFVNRFLESLDRKKLFKKGAKNRTTLIGQALEEAGDSHWELFPQQKSDRKQLVCDFMLLGKRFTRSYVAMESEWTEKGDHSENYEYDFRKLFLVNAPIKLFVYRVRKKYSVSVKDIRNDLTKAFNKFQNHASGDVYYVIELLNVGHSRSAPALQQATHREGVKARLVFRTWP